MNDVLQFVIVAGAALFLLTFVWRSFRRTQDWNTDPDDHPRPL